MKYDSKISGKNVVYVFLHGWGVDRKIYNNIINNIKHKIDYINIDLYGFGESSDPKNYFDVYEYAYQIFLLLKKLNINNIVLVGHSFGGRLSIILSSVFDVCIKKLFLTSSAGLTRFSLIKNVKILKYKLVKKLVGCGVLKSIVLSKYGSDDYKKCDQLLRLVLVKSVNQDLSYLLKYINVSTMLVWDKRDKVTPYWICKKLDSGIQNSTIVCYITGGHFTAFVNFYKFSNLILF
jgi:pimeloyl-ACP methyl ester carboxylesterase